MSDPNFLDGYNSGYFQGTLSSGLGAAARQKDDADRQKVFDDAMRPKPDGSYQPRKDRSSMTLEEIQKAEEGLQLIARSRRQVRIVEIAMLGFIVVMGFKVAHNFDTPDGTIHGTRIVPIPHTDSIQGHTGSISSGGDTANGIKEDFSEEVVRVCDKPAAQAMETAMTCFAIPSGEKVVVTTAPQAEGQYRVTKYDNLTKKPIWTGFASQQSYFQQIYSSKVAPGVPRTIQRLRVMPGAQIKVAAAFGTFYPYVSNKAPSELSVQPENRKVAVARDQVPVKNETPIELYRCDDSLCDAGIRTPGGALYGIIKQQNVKNPRDGYYGEITGPQPAAGARPAPRL